mgnify:CR=1 FL=1
MKDINATVIVNLKPTEEEIFKKLQKDARWGIKKAQKECLIIEEASSQEDWHTFYNIYRKEMSELKIPVETLDHLKKESDILFLCKLSGKVIAGAVLYHTAEVVPILIRAASIGEYRVYQPNNLLYWHCILWSKKKGYEKLDLGGWQINAHGNSLGVNKFKERWGEIVYYSKDYPVYRALGRKLIRRFDFLWWVYNKIKGK